MIRLLERETEVASLGELVRDAAAVSARGGELEREFPFGVVRQLFEPPLLDAAERTRALEGAAAAARPVFQAVDGGDASFAVSDGPTG